MKKSEKAMGVLIGFIYVVLAGGWIASGIHYKSFALMLMQTSKIGIVYYVLPPVAIVFLAGSSLCELAKNKSIALNAIMSIILSLAIFGAGMYSYSRLEYGTRDYVLYTASAYLIISAVTISVSFILMMLNSAKKKMKTELEKQKMKKMYEKIFQVRLFLKKIIKNRVNEYTDERICFKIDNKKKRTGVINDGILG